MMPRLRSRGTIGPRDGAAAVHLLAGMSVLAAVALAAAWARGYGASDTFQSWREWRDASGWHHESLHVVRFGRGGVMVLRLRQGRPPHAARLPTTRPARWTASDPQYPRSPFDGSAAVLGFGLTTREPDLLRVVVQRGVAVIFPLWLPLLLACVLPTL